MKILLLGGSVGKKSCTRTLLKYLDKLLKSKGVETIFWDMGEKPLPIAIPEFHKRPELNPVAEVCKFVRAVGEADGLIIGSPLYHGSFSGVLKNALDNLPPNALYDKRVGLISHSSNARSCVLPCYELRPIIGSLGGYPTRMQIGTTDEDYEIIAGKLVLTNQKIKDRAVELTDELISLLSIFAKNQIS